MDPFLTLKNLLCQNLEDITVVKPETYQLLNCHPFQIPHLEKVEKSERVLPLFVS